LIPVVNPLIKKGKTKQFLEAQLQSIPSVPLEKNGLRYWFHCASLGEFEQARPLMESLKNKDASNSIVVTFFSPSGFQQRHNYALADKVIYLPLDSPSSADKVINYLQADVAIFVKYEIWYFYLKALFRKNIPVFLISAVFREKQFLFTLFGKFLFKLLPQYSGIFVQDKNTFNLLKSKGLENVFLSGDTRYDRVKQLSLLAQENEKIAQFKGNKQLIILGSSWPEEERILHAFYLKNPNHEFKFLIVPHDVSEGHITEVLNRFSAYNPQLYTDGIGTESNVMVLNTIGHLASAYLYADFAFIGGAFGKGLHNILEALSYGVPLVFGPNTEKYPEADLAIKAGVSLRINNVTDFENALAHYLKSNEIQLHRLACKSFIEENSGATDMVLKSIENKLILQKK
jgi:3-deoxy-D-manno-octulosonic-acid transferase